MEQQHEDTATTQRDDTATQPLLAEDLLLLLFNPDDGTIGGEGTLFYVLAGAMLTELTLTEQVSVEQAGLRGTLVTSVGETPPTDAHLRAAWDYTAAKPREVQGLLAAIGPQLRAPLLDRLVERGDLDRERGKTLGIIPKTTLTLGAASRRSSLMRDVRATLVDGAEPDTRTAALAALISASGAMPTLHKEIPWTSATVARAQELQQGDWGAAAAAAAVLRTMTAIVVNSVIASTVAATAAGSANA